MSQFKRRDEGSSFSLGPWGYCDCRDLPYYFWALLVQHLVLCAPRSDSYEIHMVLCFRISCHSSSVDSWCHGGFVCERIKRCPQVFPLSAA